VYIEVDVKKLPLIKNIVKFYGMNTKNVFKILCMHIYNNIIEYNESIFTNPKYNIIITKIDNVDISTIIEYSKNNSISFITVYL
jgi:hypothetical protein